LDSSLRSLSFWMFSPVYSYLDWYMKQDMHAAYRVYREHLQIFQAETPDRRLTLQAIDAETSWQARNAQGAGPFVPVRYSQSRGAGSTMMRDFRTSRRSWR
jgi:hypothetical protein